MPMDGDIVVIGNVMGGHLLEDIQVNVPMNTKVRIPAKLALRSRDLYISLQQKYIRRDSRDPGLFMKDTSGAKELARIEVENEALRQEVLTLRGDNETLKGELLVLKRENKALSLDLEASKKTAETLKQEWLASRLRESALEKTLKGFHSQLEDIGSSLHRLEQRPMVAAAPGSTQEFHQSTGVVDVDTHDYIPDMHVEGAEVHLELRREESSPLNEASSKLRALRRQKTD